MDGASITTIAIVKLPVDPSWKIGGFGGFNGDGWSDVLWRNSSTGTNFIDTMNGSSIAASAVVEPDQNWKIAAIGDCNSDGKADIFWRSSTTGSNVSYFMNGSLISSAGS